eukprot:CAMPEP_0172897216 /NCGR_PEP_ID=MMETSP1075-20121228/157060_1 /TAXON_ID=2916 /ORGANISM="Ceratium fusus, Strain PA161109" /LENGTH=68 /DNA_ID=CAMNT_0013752743 /DNA_START=76 /DNA_END=282 /DNA_ORIENTATION=+
MTSELHCDEINRLSMNNCGAASPAHEPRATALPRIHTKLHHHLALLYGQAAAVATATNIQAFRDKHFT